MPQLAEVRLSDFSKASQHHHFSNLGNVLYILKRFAENFL